MNSRPYQDKAIDAVFEQWEKVTSTCIVMATGLGKTVTFAKIIDRKRANDGYKRALVIAHRKELIEQAQFTIMRATGLESDIEMGWQSADSELWKRKPVVIATVQSLNSGGGKRMQKWKPEDFSLIVCDEFHHGTSDSYRRVFDYFKQNPDLKILGVTATPDRADEEALSQVCDSVAFHYDILDGVNDGWLVPVTQQFCPVSSLDFSHVRTTAGDLNEGDLAKIMEAEENIQGVCQPTLEVLYGLEPKTLTSIPVPQWGEFLEGLGKKARRTIVFTVSVAQAEALCLLLKRVVPDIAQWLCGKTPMDDREDILKDFKSGKIPVVVNCGVLTEGFDAPETEVIVMARPTKSRSLYTQMCGRSTRPIPGIVDGLDTVEERVQAIKNSVKPFCRIVDFAGNSGRHKLICAFDILGGKRTKEEIEETIESVKESGKPILVTNKLISDEKKRAKEREEFLREVEEERRRNVVAKVDYERIHIDPFGEKRFEWKDGNKKGIKPATAAQLRALWTLGINTKADWSLKQASMLISDAKANEKEGKGWTLSEKHQWAKQRRPQ